MSQNSTYQNFALSSEAGSGYSYYFRKGTKGEKAANQIRKKKYDPKKRKHVFFKQTKITWRPK